MSSVGHSCPTARDLDTSVVKDFVSQTVVLFGPPYFTQYYIVHMIKLCLKNCIILDYANLHYNYSLIGGIKLHMHAPYG
jgi:hypothetical protein